MFNFKNNSFNFSELYRVQLNIPRNFHRRTKFYVIDVPILYLIFHIFISYKDINIHKFHFNHEYIHGIIKSLNCKYTRLKS